MITGELTEKLKTALACNDKTLAILLGVPPASLSCNIEKPWLEIKDATFGRHLSSILHVVEHLQRDRTLDPITINRVLLTPRYKLSDGNMIDVLTAIRSGLPNQLVVEIAEVALCYLRSKNKE